MCKRAETDLEFARQLQGGVNALKHDFTQYYKTTEGVEASPPQPAVPVQAQAVAVGGTD